MAHQCKGAVGGFDWRAVETHLNSFPHWKISVQYAKEQFQMRFTGLFSEKKDAILILMLHGWPGSFLEFLPIMSILMNGYSPATLPYHIIVPSLPEYAFSSLPPLNRDFRIEDIAAVVNMLIVDLELGSGYVAQGGDIGGKVSRVLGAEHPECRAVHNKSVP